jgi:tetratricopeptide (TPR) repeat protein
LILDNRLYLPLAGIALGAAVFGEQLLARVSHLKRLFTAGWVAVLVLLSVISLRHSRAFESPRAFCEAAVQGSPHLALAQVNMGSTEYRDGNFEAAEQRFRRAIAIDPQWPVAHNNLGLLYLNRGQLAQAEGEFLAELQNNPDYPKAHFNLGLVLAATERPEEARQHFERVVQILPTDINAWGELLKYWGPRDARRAGEIMNTMQQLGVQFHSPDGS